MHSLQNDTWHSTHEHLSTHTANIKYSYQHIAERLGLGAVDRKGEATGEIINLPVNIDDCQPPDLSLIHI